MLSHIPTEEDEKLPSVQVGRMLPNFFLVLEQIVPIFNLRISSERISFLSTRLLQRDLFFSYISPGASVIAHLSQNVLFNFSLFLPA